MAAFLAQQHRLLELALDVTMLVEFAVMGWEIWGGVTVKKWNL